jgi:hypothetical protein
VLSSVPANTQIEVMPGEEPKRLSENGFTGQLRPHMEKIISRVDSVAVSFVT